MTATTQAEALAAAADRLADEARQLAEHVTRTVDPIAAIPAREAAARLQDLVDLLDEIEQ
jgi:hypothetical protein